MTNKVTKAERERLYTHAAELRHQGLNRDQVIAQLRSEGISKGRAIHAIAKVRLRENKPG